MEDIFALQDEVTELIVGTLASGYGGRLRKAWQPRGETPNGKKFYRLAEEEERRGDVPKAVGHLKMALTFEPNNEHFKRELERLQPPRKKKKLPKA